VPAGNLERGKLENWSYAMCNCGESDENQCGCCGDGCSDGSCNCEDRCCGKRGNFQRRYQTKAEQIAELEAYLSELKLEVQAVEERLADLRK
jgi:hypothetical protein